MAVNLKDRLYRNVAQSVLLIHRILFSLGIHYIKQHLSNKLILQVKSGKVAKEFNMHISIPVPWSFVFVDCTHRLLKRR